MTSERALVNEGVASTFYIILTQGALLTAMGLFFGLNAVWIGITASFPLAFQVVQIINPWLLARVRSRKRLLFAANSGRFLWIILMVAMLRGSQSPLLFVIVFGVTQMTNAVAGNTWMSLVRDVVPSESHRSFVARRNSFIAVITVALVFFYSWVVDVLPAPWNWTVVLGISFVGTVLSLVFIGPVREPEYSGANYPGTWAVILADRNFMRLCLSFFVWNAVILISAPFFSYHQIANLGLPMTIIGLACIGLFAGVQTERYVPPHTMVMNVLSIIGRRPAMRAFETLRLDFRPRERRRFPRGTAQDRR